MEITGRVVACGGVLIVEATIGWCREQGFAWVSLHASEAGRHLYESLGFKPTTEMRLMLK